MLLMIAILLLVLWVLGLASSFTLGGWIHLLIVLAVIAVIFNFVGSWRKA